MELSKIEMERNEWECKYKKLELHLLERNQNELKTKCAEDALCLERVKLQSPYPDGALMGSWCPHELAARCEMLENKIEAATGEYNKLEGEREELKRRIQDLESR